MFLFLSCTFRACVTPRGSLLPRPFRAYLPSTMRSRLLQTPADAIDRATSRDTSSMKQKVRRSNRQRTSAATWLRPRHSNSLDSPEE